MNTLRTSFLSSILGGLIFLVMFCVYAAAQTNNDAKGKIYTVQKINLVRPSR